MNRLMRYAKALPCFFSIFLLAALVAGCGDNDRHTPSTAPTVSSTSTDDNEEVPVNRKLSVTFSTPMDPATITTETFTLTGPGATPVAGAVTYVGTTATFTPADNLAADTTFTATITTGAKDLAGKALASDFIWTFTTGASADVTSPTVNSTGPVDDSPGVPTNTNVTATFSEVLDPATITTDTFTVTGPAALSISGAVSYAGTTATFTPASSLAAGTQYIATITTGVTDLADNALAEDFIWTFTTSGVETQGPAPVNLGTAGNYVILAKSAVSTTGTTAVVGNIGISPAAQSFITGFSEAIDATNEFATAGIVTGKIYAADMAPPTPSNLTTAVGDMQTAYTDAAGRSLPDYSELGAGDISGETLVPGLYKWGTGVLIARDVTLSGGANDVWIFQIANDLTVGNGVIVTLSGGALPENIFWQVAGQTTLGTTSDFKGIILCQTKIVLGTGAVLNGRALAQTAVTLDANAVTQPAQ